MAEGGCVDVQSLQEFFKSGWDAQKKVDSDDFNSSSDEDKDMVLKGIHSLERATHLASQLSLFSGNEGVEDIATTDLKYLLLPALLGELTMQISDGDRLENILKGRVYFVDYLQRCKSYAITSEDPPSTRNSTASASGPSPPPSRPSYEQLAAERSAKIARLKERKEMEKKLKELTVRVELSLVSPRHHVDEEVLRDHALTLLRVWALRCHDNVRSIDQEVELLESMQKEAEPTAGKPHPPEAARPPMKPVVITREMLQGKVFGAGYPSLPTMSVEEFYEQRHKEEMEKKKREEGNTLPVRVYDNTVVGGARGRKDLEVEEEMEEGDKSEVVKGEDDSEEALKKARERDEFKDDNRTGWGNKKNMG